MKRNLSNLQAWHPAINKGLKTLQKKEKRPPYKTRTSKNKEPHPQRWEGGGGVVVVVVVGKNSCYPLRVVHTELVKGNMRSSGEDILHMPIHPLQHCEIQLLGAILIQLWQGLTRLLLLCCHSSAFPETTSSNFSPTPLNIQKPKKKKKKHTHTHNLTHTTKQSPTSLSFPFLSLPLSTKRGNRTTG